MAEGLALDDEDICFTWVSGCLLHYHHHPVHHDDDHGHHHHPVHDHHDDHDHRRVWGCWRGKVFSTLSRFCSYYWSGATVPGKNQFNIGKSKRDGSSESPLVMKIKTLSLVSKVLTLLGTRMTPAPNMHDIIMDLRWWREIINDKGAWRKLSPGREASPSWVERPTPGWPLVQRTSLQRLDVESFLCHCMFFFHARIAHLIFSVYNLNSDIYLPNRLKNIWPLLWQENPVFHFWLLATLWACTDNSLDMYI